MVCQTATAAVMYELLKPVDSSLARTAAAFGCIGNGLEAFATFLPRALARMLFLPIALFSLFGAL